MSDEQTNFVQVIPNGPLKVSKSICIKTEDGDKDNNEKDVFICRCGASENKPYCDGRHRKIEFKG